MMTKTEYQQHLLDEYASYLRKAISNKTQNYEFTPTQLASALLKAFEKGAAKGILYESQNDVERVSQFVKKPSECFSVDSGSKTNEQPKSQERVSKQDVDKALESLIDLITGAMAHKF